MRAIGDPPAGLPARARLDHRVGFIVVGKAQGIKFPMAGLRQRVAPDVGIVQLAKRVAHVDAFDGRCVELTQGASIPPLQTLATHPGRMKAIGHTLRHFDFADRAFGNVFGIKHRDV